MHFTYVLLVCHFTALNCENLQNGELELAVKNKNPPFDGSFRSGESGARGSRDAGPGSGVKI